MWGVLLTLTKKNVDMLSVSKSLTMLEEKIDVEQLKKRKIFLIFLNI